MDDFLANNLGIIMALIIMALCIISTVQIIINKKIKKQLDTYIGTIKKLNEYDNADEAFKSLYQKLDQTNNFCEATKQRCKDTEEKLQNSIQKLGFVKYSTHDTGKNELSFAIAMLDNNNDGIILNQVHTRNMSNIYAKQIEQGKAISRLSEEEAMALNDAINDKDYVKRKKI